jgi:hypothetical protein
MYHQFSIQQFYVLPTQRIYVFCVDLRTNSDYFPIQHILPGSYNRDGECLLCGTDLILKCDGGQSLPITPRGPGFGSGSGHVRFVVEKGIQ